MDIKMKLQSYFKKSREKSIDTLIKEIAHTFQNGERTDEDCLNLAKEYYEKFLKNE
jgi:hypothetical protein